jgi:hypothetical protein
VSSSNSNIFNVVVDNVWSLNKDLIVSLLTESFATFTASSKFYFINFYSDKYPSVAKSKSSFLVVLK